MGEFINYQVYDRIALITLNRPPVNALNDVMFSEMNEVFDELAAHVGLPDTFLGGKHYGQGRKW
jgi:enoyl-CoA hydratase/carnithine racemase